MFHQRTGSLVLLTHGNTLAQRINASQEFNNAIVFSAEPLRHDILFEVKIDKRVRTWSGNIEIGITTQSPSVMNIPASATDFSNGCWIMSGNSIVKSGRALIENYGQNLEDLIEGDRVGVVCKRNGDIHFFVNGVDLGVAVSNLFGEIYAIVDLYGKCAAVSIVGNDFSEEITGDIGNDMRLLSRFLHVTSGREDCVSTASSTYESVGSRMWSPEVFSTTDSTHASAQNQQGISGFMSDTLTEATDGILHNEALRFNRKCGGLIRLSNGHRCAERTRPLDEFNNGIVFTNRPLRCDEMFEIMLESVVDKWSGSVEIGVTTLNPNTAAELPSSVAYLPEGTIIMSGRSLSVKGSGNRREYGEFNLDDLIEGDRVGLKVKSSGEVHFYVNGIDQGCAVKNAGSNLFGIVDLYGMAAKVRIVNATWNSWATARHLNSVMSGIATSEHSAAILPACEIYEPLRFDDICGRNAVVINNGQAAFRPNSSEQFENAIVFTNRPLNDGEIFQVEIVRSIDKWAGSLEIGLLAIKPPNSDSVPSTIMKFSSGCWYLMGEKVMLNGNVVKEQYGRRHLERLHKGDRIGVVRRAEGSLHFLINGEDQGVAAVGIPSGLYGVVDLYGQVVQIALVDMEIEETSAALFGPQISNCVSVTSEMRFLRSRHGVNVVVGADGSNAVRLEAEDEFNNAVVMSDRVLKRDELIQLKVDRIITRWSGSLEIGLTTTEPAKYRIPVTLSESDDNLWLLCGSSFLVQNGSNSSESEANGIEYSLNLNLVEQGDVVGLKIHQNGQLHFYLNGVDQGVACEMPDVEVLLLVDLYGQCVEVTLLPPTFVVEVSPVIIEAESESLFDEAFVACVDLLEIPHELSTCVSSGICLEMENQLARRTRSDAKSIVWSKESIREGEEFEIKLESVKESPRNGHSFKIGFLLAKDFPTQKDVLSWNRLSKGIWGQFFFISGHSLFVDTINLGENFCPCLNLLPVGSKVGCAVRKGGFVHFTLNGSDFGFICNGSSVYCVVELAGRCEIISVSSTHHPRAAITRPDCPAFDIEKSDAVGLPKSDAIRLEDFSWRFSESHGKHIHFDQLFKRATRKEGFDQGIVFSQFPILPNIVYHVRIDKVDCTKYNSGSAAFGLIKCPYFTPDNANTIVNLRSSFICFLINSVIVSQSFKTKCDYHLNVAELKEKDVVGIGITVNGELHFYLNGVDQGIAARGVPLDCQLVIDLYGPVEEISIVLPMRDNLDIEFQSDKDAGREKADTELTGEDESLVNESLLWTIPDVNCEFAALCSRLLHLLHIPFEYLGEWKCSCSHCLCATLKLGKSDHEENISSTPGWYRRAVKLSKTFEYNTQQLASTKVRAYQGVKVHLARKVFDTYLANWKSETMGQSNALVSSQSNIRRQSSTEDFSPKTTYNHLNVQKFILSPNITRTTVPLLAPWFCLTDKISNRKLSVKVAFEVWLNSNGYKIYTDLPSGLESIPSTENSGNPSVSIYEVEQFWALKDKSAVVSAILLNVVFE